MNNNIYENWHLFGAFGIGIIYFIISIIDMFLEYREYKVIIKKFKERGDAIIIEEIIKRNSGS